MLTWEIESFSSNLGWFTTPTQHKNWFVELRPLEPFVKIEIEHRERLSIFIQIMAVSDESVQHFSVRWDITQIELENLYKQFLELSQTFPVKKEQS